MKRNQIIIILALLLIAVVVWIAINVYHNLKESTISEVTNQEILPINPSFDTKVIEILKEREEVSPAFELEKLPTPVPSKTPESSPSSKLNTQPPSDEG